MRKGLPQGYKARFGIDALRGDYLYTESIGLVSSKDMGVRPSNNLRVRASL